jgi:hypothetical protein
MAPHRIIAVDPGKMTGVCQVDPHGWCVWSAPAMSAVERINTLITSGHVIVVERFIFQSIKQTAQYDALEVTGALRYLASRYRILFEQQDRAARKRVTLPLVKMFVDPKNDHELDAAQHAIVAAVRHRVIDPAQLATID